MTEAAENAEEPVQRGVVFVLDVEERPGILHAIAAVFAHRGLSIRALVADASRHAPRILVAFRGTPRQCRRVEQVLGRLHDVQRLRVLADDAPEIHAAAMCHFLGGDVPPLGGVECRREAGTLLLSGRYAAVVAAVDRLELTGQLQETFLSLVAL